MQSYALRLIKGETIITNHYYINMVFIRSKVTDSLRICLGLTQKKEGKLIRPRYDKEPPYEIDSSNASKHYLCLKLLSLQTKRNIKHYSISQDCQ